MSERKTLPVTPKDIEGLRWDIDHPSQWAPAYFAGWIARLIDDVADRDATIAALTERAEAAEARLAVVEPQLLAAQRDYNEAEAARAVTPGATRLARCVAQVTDYLERTNEPTDILRSAAAPQPPQAEPGALTDTQATHEDLMNALHGAPEAPQRDGGHVTHEAAVRALSDMNASSERIYQPAEETLGRYIEQQASVHERTRALCVAVDRANFAWGGGKGSLSPEHANALIDTRHALEDVHPSEEPTL